jgi:ribosomal protein S18 acetylase RimI-like enzyme
MLRIKIRPAKTRDATAIAAVQLTAAREVYANLLPVPLLRTLTVELRAMQWRDIILNRPSSFHNDRNQAVFVVDKKFVGLIGFGFCSSQRTPHLIAKGFGGEFQSIYTVASERGNGIGQALMANMAAHLLQRDIRGVSCWVLRENLRARKFYERLHGNLIDERIIKFNNKHICTEVAYGWSDLNALADLSPCALLPASGKRPANRIQSMNRACGYRYAMSI